MFAVDYNSYAISMHKGDTGAFKIRAVRASGEAWTEYDRLIWTIRGPLGNIVMQRYYRLDDKELGNGVALIQFDNADTDTWTTGNYNTERRYIIHPSWTGEARTENCVDAMTSTSKIVDGYTVRVPKNGHSTLLLSEVFAEV